MIAQTELDTKSVGGVTMSLETLSSFAWATIGIPFAQLAVRVDDIATKFGVSIHAWEENGLGPARGLIIRLTSGRVIFLEELALALEFHGAKGPTVYADAADLGEIGVDQFVAEVLSELRLSPSDLAKVATQEGQRAAAEMAAQINAARAKRESMGLT
jgi:hypothetical protein